MSSQNESTKPQALADQGYDRGDPQIFGVIATTIGIIVVLVVVGIGVEYYFDSYRDRVIEELQLEPVSQDLLDLRAKEDKELSTYAVADKAAGIYRLPVSRAMDLVINESKEGKPKYPVTPYIVKKAEDDPAATAAPATK
ncbi:MAG: hypothetical protein FJW30_10270 [Acidobacteria bacterium]|nr:hypothetical protein [Acidobacteriota bacterium]